MNTEYNSTLRALGGALTALVLLSACAGNPATGGADIVLTTQGREVAIGQEMHQKFIDEGAPYDDPELQAYINRVGQGLVANSDRPDMDFTFTVMDSPDINAFATPGGFIYINRGLLAYLENEAELAGVLAHEIGHVTARHHGRRQTAGITNTVLATTVYILTGSGDIADATSMYGAELISGYGRDMELEADGLGARYMHSAGYDPEALLEVIGVLKDQQQFQRVKAKSGGKKVSTYHGLYASHPRNDQRLKTVIRAADDLDQQEQTADPEVPGEFRRQMDGLVWGQSIQQQRAEDRYYHNKLAFTFEHPPTWTVAANAQSIVASAKDGAARLTLTLRRRNTSVSPQALMESEAGGELGSAKALEQAGLTGYTAIARSGSKARRLAVIDYAGLSYLFEGEATNDADFDAIDSQLLAMIESFRPMHPRERQTGGDSGYVRYIQVPRGATMASLAASIRMDDAEAQLRLINGLYPRGEPRTGDWIKVIR